MTGPIHPDPVAPVDLVDSVTTADWLRLTTQSVVVGRPSQPFGLRAPSLLDQPAFDGSAGRACGTSLRRWRSDGLGEDRHESIARGLTVAELRPLLRRGDRQHSVDQPPRQTIQRPRPLHGTERRRGADVEAQLHA